MNTACTDGFMETKPIPTSLMYHELAVVISEVARLISTDMHDALQIANIRSAFRNYDFNKKIVADKAKTMLRNKNHVDCICKVDTIIEVASND